MRDHCPLYEKRCDGWLQGFIYVLRVVTKPRDASSYYGPMAPVTGWKVGFTTALPGRVEQHFKRCQRVTVVAVGHGSYADEQEIHRALRHLRMCEHHYCTPTPNANDWYADLPEFRQWKRAFRSLWRGWVVRTNRDVNGRSRHIGRWRVRDLWQHIKNVSDSTRATCPVMTYRASRGEVTNAMPDRERNDTTLRAAARKGAA